VLSRAALSVVLSGGIERPFAVHVAARFAHEHCARTINGSPDLRVTQRAIPVSELHRLNASLHYNFPALPGPRLDIDKRVLLDDVRCYCSSHRRFSIPR